ncbi:hypothetical protein Csp1_25010 [Corynebacterium provencense]|uniref:DUF732 domain-containing protein n=1 Tax=Corynebacterium provencense TaxID=1737425 RepID=A0A2Z3YSH2_9CORY|nr:DUF732 domain-containing protein [Corynebacterium provencense]AWT27249.1 hypothetical protein Csp1_25010 [Corynebacterium provencense]
MTKLTDRAHAGGRPVSLGILALVTAGALAGLTACGDDSSTAEGTGTAAVAPSTVVPANPTSTDGTVATTTPNPHSGNGGSGAGEEGSGSTADGGVTEITELPPASSVRSEADDAFLGELRANGIDITDQVTQDQVIAAGHEQCQANSEGRESFSVPAIAGQLGTLGVTDKAPEESASVIRSAAEAHFCS